jgi:hypothetical protein
MRLPTGTETPCESVTTSEYAPGNKFVAPGIDGMKNPFIS